MLEHLRVLDLTDERGLLCGRLLADLGADVVAVEPRDGSGARQEPPIAAGDGPARSLYWETYAAGKRGVAVDLDDATDVERLRGLAAAADVVVISWPRATVTRLGLDPDTLRAAHPGLVVTVISAFGWDGPKADYADGDLVVWAAGGPLAPHRDGDRPPLRISVPQAFLHAAADAAAGTVLAVLARGRTGAGQVVDVSAQAAVGVATLARVLAAAVGDDHPEWHTTPGRTDQSGSGAATPNSHKKWHCRDGLVELHLSMGPAAGAFTNNLFAWLRDEGAVTGPLASWDWRTVPDRLVAGELTPDDLDTARAAVRAFLLTRTKAEIIEAALHRRLLCMAIADMTDVLASPHLAARDFWARVDLDGREVRLPGRMARVHGPPGPRVCGRAPRLGEHTDAVLAEWSGSRTDGPRTDGSRTVSPASGGAGDPLAGLRVLDLSWVVAGPLIGRALADFGADVVRVESSVRVETARLMQPFHGGVADREGSALFGTCNAGKRGITLDLGSAAGQQVVRDLVARADVVVESFSPGRMARWGLDAATLRAQRPDLVVLSTSIAGQDGPWSTLAGFGNVGSSLSGFQHLVGWEDRLPMGTFGPYTDYVGPRLGLVTLLAALEHRRRTGQGATIDLAQVEAGLFFLSPQVAHADLDGTVAARRGNRDARHTPHGVFACARADGDDEAFVALLVRDGREWRELATAMGRPDLGDRADLADVEGRRAAEDEIEVAVAGWAVRHGAPEVEQLLQARGVPAHVAVTPRDYLHDAQLAHRGHLVALAHERFGTTWVEGPRYRLSATPGRPRAAAPELGRHTDEVLREDLGYDEDRIRTLHEEGVLR